MFKADFHCHSYYSNDSMMKVKKIYKFAKKKDLSAIAIVDHNSIGSKKKISQINKKQEDFIFILGEEIKTSRGEIIALNLQELIPKKLSVEETLDKIKEQDALAIIPHPYDFARKALNYDLANLSKNTFIEVANGRVFMQRFNDKAKNFATDFNYPVSAGSDAHSYSEIGNYYLNFKNLEQGASLDEILKEFKKQNVEVRGHKSPFGVHINTPLSFILKSLGKKNM